MDLKEIMKQRNLTEGNITANLIYFALPMMAGNLLQQCYNIADTLIVGRFLGSTALAAVGSSYTLMTFLTSILLGLCMGSGAVFSICFGEGDSRRLKSGMVHSFGMIEAAAVKIDSFAYMPVQDFGNAFSTFVAQNYGAGKTQRIRKGIKSAVLTAFVFCVVISLGVCILARPLMGIFVKSTEKQIIEVGVEYLRIEGAFYFGIGLLFLLYGFYRAVKRPGMSVILTVCSLGTRVLLAYTLSAVPAFGVKGIWISVPIGWALADTVGVIYYKKKKKILEITEGGAHS